MEFMSSAMSAQIPKLILETAKVVQTQINVENQDSARSLSAFNKEMKAIKLRQEEVVSQSKMAALKSDGNYLFIHYGIKQKKQKKKLFLITFFFRRIFPHHNYPLKFY